MYIKIIHSHICTDYSHFILTKSIIQKKSSFDTIHTRTFWKSCKNDQSCNKTSECELYSVTHKYSSHSLVLIQVLFVNMKWCSLFTFKQKFDFFSILVSSFNSCFKLCASMSWDYQLHNKLPNHDSIGCALSCVVSAGVAVASPPPCSALVSDVVGPSSLSPSPLKCSIFVANTSSVGGVTTFSFCNLKSTFFFFD